MLGLMLGQCSGAGDWERGTGMRKWNGLLAGGLLAGMALAAHAQSPMPEDGNARAARLSSVDGQVQVVVDGQVVADPAYANLPLFEGSQVVTRNDGRAEITTDDGNIIRVTPNSTVTLTALQGATGATKTEVVVNAGEVYFELQPSTDSRAVRMDFGTTSVVPSAFSVLRVNYDSEPGSMAIFSGQVHVTRGSSLAVDAHGGQMLSLDPGDPSAYNLSDTIQPDSWDQWNTDRDNALESEQSASTQADQQLPPDAASSAADLNANGNWYDVPGEGYVWSPYDAQGAGENWDPYGYGYWTSYPTAGYVWISGYNWGYAPYNCGSWNFYGGFGWGWNPRGGCHPWWHRRRWMSNIGHAPSDYHAPVQPRHPVAPVGGNRVVATGHPLRPVKPILVDRRPSSGVNAYLGFQPGQPMVVGGQVVSPVHTVAPRTSYVRSYTYLSDRTPLSVRHGLEPGRGGYVPRTTYNHMPSTSFGRPSAGFSGATHMGGMHLSGGGVHMSSGGGAHH